MKIRYSKPAKDGLDKHATYLRELKKNGPKKYDHINVKQANKELKDNITLDIDNKDSHSDSIFPDKYEYGHSNYKMHIDKKHHYIVFYKIIKTKSGTEYISIEKCEHSNDIRKELEEKNIKPLKSANPELLLDYTIIEKETCWLN